MIEALNPRSAYTLAEWTVKPGAEHAFTAEWTQFSEWLLEHRGAESFSLLKGPQGSRHFVSVAVWSGRGATVHWAEFLRRLGKCRVLCEQSRSRTCRPAARIGRGSHMRPVELVA